MSSIDAVIARARQPGAMSSRKRFTVSRKRAIQKLRKFALADPHAYVLELIQSAIANGAAYVDLQLSQKTVTLSYVGGGLREDELASLFDFLFASKDRSDVADVRALALGLNAVLRFEPEAVIVESGDGTRSGTTRMTLRPGSDEVEIGKPASPLAGTYVRIEGMDRKALGEGWKKYANAQTVREVRLIESKCMAAPIPIVVNGESQFGFGSQRIPNLPGYERTIDIDEGDLYGVVGIDPGWGGPSFELLTYGVRITAKAREFVSPGKSGGPKVGGILCFNALHKTVDHSGIVEDARYEEMWARVWPYVRQLSTQRDGTRSPYEVRLAGHDETLAIPVLRDMLVSSPRVLVVGTGRAEAEVGLRMGQALDAPVLCADARSFEDLRRLAGQGVHMLRPLVNDAAFYDREALAPPPRPWVVEPTHAKSPAMEFFVEALTQRLAAKGVRDAGTRQQLEVALGRAEPRIEVYLPDSEYGLSDSRLELRVCGRRLASRSCPEFPAGRVILVEFPELSPSRFAQLMQIELPESGRGWSEAFELLIDVLDDALEFAVAELGEAVLTKMVRGGMRSAAARSLALQALAQRVAPVLTFDGERPRLEMWTLGGDELGLDFPLFRQRGERDELLSLRALCERINAGAGVAYGSVPEVRAALDGVERESVLSLELGQEEHLLELFDDTSYVRVDVREVLARAGGWVVRDRAPGVEPPRAGALPVEAELVDPKPYDDALEAALVQQLLTRAWGRGRERPQDEAEAEIWEVCRKEAAAHLRALALGKRRAGLKLGEALSSLELFVDNQGRRWSLESLQPLAEAGRLVARYGDPDAGGVESMGGPSGEAESGETVVLVLDLPSAQGLSDWLGAAPAVDPERETLEHSVELTSGGRARLRLLDHAQLGAALVTVVSEDHGELHELSLAARYGVRGLLERRASLAGLPELVLEASRALWISAVTTLRAKGIDDREGLRIAELALGVVERCTRLSLVAGRGLHAELHDPLAGLLAGVPLFRLRNGGRVSARGMIRRANRLASADPRPKLLENLDSELPAPLRAWVERIFDPTRAVVQRGFQSTARARDEESPSLPLDGTQIAASVKLWINALRPDAQRVEHCFTHYVEHGGEGISANATGVRLDIEDPRITTMLFAKREEDPVLSEGFATLLLCVYGKMNYYEDQIVLEHELSFQRRVLQALRDGVLHVLHAPA